MKHAYLILAHTDFGNLKRLVNAIDDERNDIYIHFDAKVSDIPDLRTQKAGLTVLERRARVYWGDVSVVEAEYLLFEAAAESGVRYSYFHLLSGADLPLKSQDYIHDFFSKNDGKEFIGYTLNSITPELERKVLRWHIFPQDFRNASVTKRILRHVCLRAQEILHISRNQGIDFKKGSQWVSITERMVELFLGKKEWAMKTFSHSFCSDEVVMQTICFNSALRSNIFNTTDDAHGCMRAISWENGVMKTWSEEDYERLCRSEFIFARKFTSHHEN